MIVIFFCITVFLVFQIDSGSRAVLKTSFIDCLNQEVSENRSLSYRSYCQYRKNKHDPYGHDNALSPVLVVSLFILGICP